MTAPNRPNLSDDLLWGITRSQNAYMVRRPGGGGVQFSRDPLNLVNKTARKYSGFANQKAVGIQAGEKGAIEVTTKNPSKWNKPASNFNTDTISSTTSNRKVSKGISNRTAQNASRPDLRGEAVARASALRRAQRPKKETPQAKPRGAKARKAAEKGE